MSDPIRETLEPPAPADPSDFQTLQGIALDMVESLRPIVLPEILGVLRRAIKQAPAPAPAGHVPDAGNVVAADGEAEELAQWLDHKGRGAWPCPDGFSAEAEAEEYEMFSGLTRAAALLREARPQPVPVADGEREEREELATFLRKEAVAMDYWFERDTAKKVRRAAALLRQPAHAPVPANAWGCPECLRELREELARLRGSAADGEREELAQWLYGEANDYDDLYPPESSLKLYRAAALLREARPQPVPVADRPWERPGWCDAEGRCWWGRCADDFFSPEWTMATLASIEEFCSDAMPQHCLPHWAIAIPQPPQGGEVES